MTPLPPPPNEEFAAAAQSWNLDQLYVDLADAKGKRLTKVEKQYLRGLLCHHSPNEIAEHLHVASDTVRNYLSKGLYRYIEEVLIRQEHADARVKDWSRVPHLLEQVGYRRGAVPSVAPIDAEEGLAQNLAQNLAPYPSASSGSSSWQGIPDVPVFYGRTQELSTLNTWISTNQCRLIALLGIGGIGKTTLAAYLAQQAQNQYDVVLWRSLRSQPTIKTLLDSLFHAISSVSSDESRSPDFQLHPLLEVLQQRRCLIVLEDMQFILRSGEFAGHYQPNYERYAELLRRVGEVAHSSCLVVTSWEKPLDVSMMEGSNRPVRSLQLEGLGEASRLILRERQLTDEALWDELIMAYRGNPLALKIVATTIQDLFGGSVEAFLDQSTFFLGDLTYLLHEQFQRLSDLEQAVIACLSAAGEPLSLPQLRQVIQVNAAWSDLLKALESVGRRSLTEKITFAGETRFTLQPMVMRYAKRHPPPG
ncbi:MAG TPA: NB-ARC domain-containing protein [Elainellaceae cyanobacterium]